MTNQEEILMRNNEWIATLEKVAELRNNLIQMQSGEIFFGINGDWYYKSNEYNSPKDFHSPHFILTSEHIGNIDEGNVENVILNILRLLDFYNTYINFYYDSGISFEDYIRKEENSNISTILLNKTHDSLCYSYSFYVNSDRNVFNYTVSWSENGKGMYIVFDNSKYGYTNFYDLIMFLLEESDCIPDYQMYTQFCKKVREFQSHYYKTTSNTDGELFTSYSEVELLNLENRKNRFNSKKGSYLVNRAVKIADIIGYFDMDIGISDKKLLEKYIDTDYLFTHFGYYEFFNNITVQEVYQIVMDTIENKLPEPFSIRKHTCRYDNRFKFVVNTGTDQTECVVEWNYLKECYRIKKGVNTYTFFESYNLLIHHIIREFIN
ncbi:hypothetical protein JUJ52_18285 [Virgibacillus sp. AGTR]|uniref:hypothetical protein n=1 Tax=Virgibacillus sp. AGTR TaxID=2812055 RepID=UPI001D162D21|nr:hypothetical protein [Virgibacillus sp. AGTR]MCC2251892.1 hypothetical protein [Virgibacillus sp. AGTR]